MTRSVVSALTPFSLLLPGVALVVVWAYLPLAETFWLSFFEGTLITGPRQFVGLANYSALLATPEFRKSVVNTLVYVLGLVPLVTVVPLALALLAAEVQGRLRDVYRAVIFAPMIVAPVVASLIWLWILNPVQGVLNDLLQMTGMPAVNWLGDETTAIWTIIGITAWKTVGLSFLLYAAALAGINREYLEAARIDGASAWQVLCAIILPLLTPTFYMVMLLAVLFAGQWPFAPINVLTHGGPNASTASVFYVLYQIAFTFFDVGQAAAAAVLLVIVTGAGLALGTWWMDRRAHYDA